MDSTDPGSTEGKSDDSVVVGEKRPADEGGTRGMEDEESVVKAKKPKNGGTDINKVQREVAEMILVLSAMQTMRGGGEPSAAEKALMKEAKRKMAAVVAEFRPKDLFPKEAIESVMQDLGLNRSKENNNVATGPPKCSIVQKMELAQRKIAETKAFAAHQQAGFPSQKLQAGTGASGNANAHVLPVEKSGHTVVSAGNFQAVTPNASFAASQPLQSQRSSHEVQPAITSIGMPSNNVIRDSPSTTAPRIIHFRPDGRPNGPSYVQSVPGNQHTTRTVVPHLQPQPPALPNNGTQNKVPAQQMVKPDGKANLTGPRPPTRITTHLQPAKPVVTQGTPGTVQNMPHSIPGMHFVHTAPVFNHHLEISKLVQKLFQPQPAQRSPWTAPSRDYMNKTLTCQTCKMTVNDVESLLVCDACEKGSHLRCLGSTNQKGLPRGEWYCSKCLSISHGKPFPPKYGRVTRNAKSPKIPSNAAGASFEKKQGMSSDQMNQQKVPTVRSSDEKHASLTSAVPESSSETKMAHVSGVCENDVSSAVKNDAGPKLESCPKSETMETGSACVSPSTGLLSNRHTMQEQVPASLPITDRQVDHSQSKSFAKPLSVTGASKQNNIDQTGVSNDSEALSGKNDSNKGTPNDLYESSMKVTEEGNLRADGKQHNQSSALENSLKTATVDSKPVPAMPSKNLRNVDWIGDVHKIVDKKKHYLSCSIDGVAYRVQDYALCRTSDGKLLPSKLQAMWEDNQTGLQWVIVNLCYFPGELPEGVGHPCGPFALDCNEVYESNHQSTIRADLIEGPCDVCPPKLFGEENKVARSNDGAHPNFVCRWFYDEIRRVFRPNPA